VLVEGPMVQTIFVFLGEFTPTACEVASVVTSLLLCRQKN
jgi:hypothetical protein